MASPACLAFLKMKPWYRFPPLVDFMGFSVLLVGWASLSSILKILTVPMSIFFNAGELVSTRRHTRSEKLEVVMPSLCRD